MTPGSSMTTTPPPARDDVVQTTLGIVFLLALIGTCFWILRPVMPAILWSSAIVVSTWPCSCALERGSAAGARSPPRCSRRSSRLLLLVPLLLGILGDRRQRGWDRRVGGVALTPGPCPVRRHGSSGCRSPVSASRTPGAKWSTMALRVCSRDWRPTADRVVDLAPRASSAAPGSCCSSSSSP